MKSTHSRTIIAALVLGAGLLASSSAAAWYQPFGAGAMTYERQNEMRDHGHAMQDLSRMFDGRRAFDRNEATRLARELEQGLGDELLRNFAPGAVVAGSRTSPWTWRNFGMLRAYSAAAQQSAANLAVALESAPDNDEVREQGAWSTSPRRFTGRWGHLRDDLVSMDAIHEYGRLNAMCHSCHSLFRGPRW